MPDAQVAERGSRLLAPVSRVETLLAGPAAYMTAVSADEDARALPAHLEGHPNG